jgi:hypothetical protein
VLAKQLFYHLSHTSSPFVSGYFGDGVSKSICLGWPKTAILLISASQVARITGVSHWYLAVAMAHFKAILSPSRSENWRDLGWKGIGSCFSMVYCGLN